VGSLDWNLFFEGNYTFAGQVLGSDTREPDDLQIPPDVSHFSGTRFTRAFNGVAYGGREL
jgi:hypothetical protein